MAQPTQKFRRWRSLLAVSGVGGLSALIAIALLAGCAPLTRPMPPVKLFNQDPATLGRVPPG